MMQSWHIFVQCTSNTAAMLSAHIGLLLQSQQSLSCHFDTKLASHACLHLSVSLLTMLGTSTAAPWHVSFDSCCVSDS